MLPDLQVNLPREIQSEFGESLMYCYFNDDWIDLRLERNICTINARLDQDWACYSLVFGWFQFYPKMLL